MGENYLDAAYRPFPAFAEWASLQVDEDRWKEEVAELPASGAISPEQLARARRIAMHAAAVDTGAIEGLYNVDRSFTMTIALQTAVWQSALDSRGGVVRSMIQSQIRAYDYVTELAAADEPISEVVIRSLHERMVESQDTFAAQTVVGVQSQPLPKGQYKTAPNHVILPGGGAHAYAPVAEVSSEMHRLVSELRSDQFRTAHPVLQAAYAHYAFVCIHPFADGNGRVARALASVFTYRSSFVPLLILVEHKPAYLTALQLADQGNLQAFADFMFHRAIDAIQLVAETLQAVTSPDPVLEAARLRDVYLLEGQDAKEQTDVAGAAFLNAFSEAYTRQATGIESDGKFEFKSQFVDPRHAVILGPRAGYRVTVDRRVLRLSAASKAPAAASATRQVHVEVPIDSSSDDDLRLVVMPPRGQPFTAKVGDLVPALTPLFKVRLAAFTEGVLGEMLAELRAGATAEIRRVS